MTRFQTFLKILLGFACLRPWFPVSAGYLLPPEMQHATPEQKQHYIQVQSELMLHQKLQAGEQRYELRRAQRLQILEQNRAVKEEREQEILGTPAPPPAAEPEPSHNSWLALISLAVLIPGGVLIYRKSSKEGDGISFVSLVWEEIKGSAAHLAGQAPLKAATLANAPVIIETHSSPRRSDSSEVQKTLSHRDRFNRIRSMRICLDISPEAREFTSEEQILELVETVLLRNQIRIEDKSPIWLTLSVTGEWDERGLTFTHREELALVESVTLIRQGVDMQTAFVNLWGSGFNEFVRSDEAPQKILGGVQQITELFADTFATVKEKQAA